MTKRQPKRSRSTKGPARPIEITPRDESLLLLVALTGYIGIDQLSRALFPSEDRCRRRVRSLYDAGYVMPTLVSSTQPSLVRLTKRGLSLVAARTSEVEQTLRLPGPLQLGSVPHRRLIIDTRLYCAALGELRRTPLIRWSNAGGCLHQELKLVDYRLASDGIAEYATRHGPLCIAIECDCSTETLGTFQKKLLRYRPVAEAGVLDALWIAITGGLERQRNIERLIADAGLGEWARVLSSEILTARPVQELPERNRRG